MIPLRTLKEVESIRKSVKVSCDMYDIRTEDFYIVIGFLINHYDKNWIWHYGEFYSQTFFSKKEALESMKENKIEWRTE